MGRDTHQIEGSPFAPPTKADTVSNGKRSSVTATAKRESPTKQKREIAQQKRKKSSTPTPYSAGTTIGKGKDKLTAGVKEKSLPLHQQPRQHSAAGGKRKGETMRAATPTLRTPKGEMARKHTASKNGTPGKGGLMYSNLLRCGTAKENLAQPSGTGKARKPLVISTGLSSHILRGLEESANKKLNKHSSSLDNTDWMACYERLRKELNLNSPKDAPPASGRISMNSMRPSAAGGVVLLGEYIPKRSLVTPTPTAGNPFTSSKNPKTHSQKQSQGQRTKPILVTSSGKFTSMMGLLGKQDGKGVQRPIVVSRLKT